MQKTIYISNIEIWQSIRHMAGDGSISGYLVRLHEENVARLEAEEKRADLITEELDIISGIPDKILKPGDNERGVEHEDN